MAEENFSPSRRSSTLGGDLDHSGSGRHRPGPGEPVPHHQAFPGGVELGGVSLEVGPALSQQRHGEHLLGGDPAISSRSILSAPASSTATALASWTSFNIGVSLPAGVNRRNRCWSTWRVRRALQAIADPQLLVISPDVLQGAEA